MYKPWHVSARAGRTTQWSARAEESGGGCPVRLPLLPWAIHPVADLDHEQPRPRSPSGRSDDGPGRWSFQISKRTAGHGLAMACNKRTALHCDVLGVLTHVRAQHGARTLHVRIHRASAGRAGENLKTRSVARFLTVAWILLSFFESGAWMDFTPFLSVLFLGFRALVRFYFPFVSRGDDPVSTSTIDACCSRAAAMP